MMYDDKSLLNDVVLADTKDTRPVGQGHTNIDLYNVTYSPKFVTTDAGSH